MHLRGLSFQAKINEDNEILEGSAQRKSERTAHYDLHRHLEYVLLCLAEIPE